jgi:hypothetical protein
VELNKMTTIIQSILSDDKNEWEKKWMAKWK